MYTCTHAHTHTLNTHVHANILNTCTNTHPEHTPCTHPMNMYTHTLARTHNIMNTEIRYGYLQTPTMGISIPFKFILERRVVERSSLGKEL